MLYHFGILQFIVRLFARVMVHLMGTSGAETLSVAANVFMGQTEAPLIIRPYVPRMTNSELFVLMASGMAHISGGLMAVYISYGADPVAVLATCVMACPCSLYLSKLFLPEVSKPETSGTAHAGDMKSPYVNAIDAAAAGTSDGLQLGAERRRDADCVRRLRGDVQRHPRRHPVGEDRRVDRLGDARPTFAAVDLWQDASSPWRC